MFFGQNNLDVYLPLARNTQDFSKNNRTITVYGTVTPTIGFTKGSHRFAGATGDYISTGSPIVDATAYTIMGWWNVDSSGAETSPTFYGEGNTGTTQQYARVAYSTTAKAIGWNVRDNAGVTGHITPSDIFQMDTWMHVAVVQESKSLRRFYINGKLLGTSTTTIGTVSTNTSLIGALQRTTTAFVTKGCIQDFATFTRALSGQEIANYYARSTSKDLITYVSLPYTTPTTTTFNRTITESLALSDLTVSPIERDRAFAESLTLTDSSSAMRIIKLAESLSIADTVFSKMGILASLSESLTLNDAMAKEYNHNRLLLETVTLTDTTNKTATFSRADAETISITDVVTGSRIQTLAETLSLVDSIASEYAYQRALTESFTITDTVSGTLVPLLDLSFLYESVVVTSPDSTVFAPATSDNSVLRLLEIRNNNSIPQSFGFFPTTTYGTAVIALGAETDTYADGAGKTFQAELMIPVIAAGASAFVWIKWERTKPVDYTISGSKHVPLSVRLF
jgi:hypothetical protein